MTNANNADANEFPGLIVTTPWAAPPISNPARRFRCAECNAEAREDKEWKGLLAGEIRHAKYCDSKAQAPAVAAELAKRAARDTDDRFRRLANQIRRSGIVKCSQEDLAELVRRGLLSVNDAMNTDG